MKNQNVDDAMVNPLAPLVLPATGYELQSGRQYYLNPAARAALHDVFGLRGLASLVECICAKNDAREVVISSKNLRTNEVVTTKSDQPERNATFRGFGKKVFVFTLSLESLHERMGAYEQGHLFNEYEKTDPYAGRKFRGVKLNNWHDDGKTGGGSVKKKEPLDLSLFDL